MTYRKNRHKHKPADMQQIIEDKMVGVVNNIMTELKKGVAPWVRPWALLGPVRNAATGTIYKGRNILALTSCYFADPRWITFRDVKSQGGHLRKGSKSSFVIKPVERSFVLNPEDPINDQKLRSYFGLKYHNVFNVEQVEGISFPEIKPLQPHNRNKKIETFIKSLQNSGLELQHGGDRAFFSPTKDFVRLPKLGHFRDADQYYCTLFHEITHYAGGQARLNREFGIFGDSKYSFEEMVAELGSSYLGAHFQVNGLISHSGSYVNSWINLFKENALETLTEASKLASEAVQFLIEMANKNC